MRIYAHMDKLSDPVPDGEPIHAEIVDGIVFAVRARLSRFSASPDFVLGRTRTCAGLPFAVTADGTHLEALAWAPEASEEFQGDAPSCIKEPAPANPLAKPAESGRWLAKGLRNPSSPVSMLDSRTLPEEGVRKTAQRILLQALAASPRFHPSCDDFNKAASILGLEMPPCPPMLRSWTAKPTSLERTGWGAPLQDLAPGALIVETDIPPHQAIPFLKAAEAAGIPLHRAEPRLAGYSWHMEIPRIMAHRIEAEIQGRRMPLEDLPSEDTGLARADRILHVLEIQEGAPGSQTSRTLEIPGDVAFQGDPAEGFSAPEDTRPVVAKGSSISPWPLAMLMTDAYFDFEDLDPQSDSPNTQERRYEQNARRFAADILLQGDDALREKIAQAIREHVLWEIPHGRTARIAVSGSAPDERRIDVVLEESEAEEAGTLADTAS